MSEKKESTWRVIQKHLMTGIGYMIPMILVPNLLNGIAGLIANIAGFDIAAEAALTDPNMLIQVLAWVHQVAFPAAQNLMYPVFAGFLAFSIGDRAALSIGLMGGCLAAIGSSGFLGALAAGFFAGYFMRWLSNKWSVSRTWRTTFNFMIYPLIGGAAMFLLMKLVIDPVGTAINTFMTHVITAIGSTGQYALQAALGAGMAIDCGGPINKATLGIGIALNTQGANVIGMMYGTMIPPLAFAIAVFIDKYILRKGLFNEHLRSAGLSSFVLGLFNVTEGALPLVLEDPVWMVIINAVGSAIGGIFGYMSGNFYNFSMTGNVLGYFMMDNPATYILGLYGGALVTAVLILIRRLVLKKKGALDADEDE